MSADKRAILLRQFTIQLFKHALAALFQNISAKVNAFNVQATVVHAALTPWPAKLSASPAPTTGSLMNRLNCASLLAQQINSTICIKKVQSVSNWLSCQYYYSSMQAVSH